jgi:hypothetical protein
VLADLALDFIFFHEFSHIHGGHLDLLQGTNGEVALVELGMTSRGVTSRERRALELDADMSACSMFIQFLGTDNWGDHARRRIFPSVESYLLAWLVAVGVVFRIFELCAPHPESFVFATHPHPAIRNWFARAGLEVECARSSAFDPAHIQPSCEAADARINTIWDAASLPRLRPRHSLNAESDHMEVALTQVMARLRSRPERWGLQT